MRSDIDEQDLYPPDVDTVTQDDKQRRMRVAAGATLLVWGTSLLIDIATGLDLDTGALGLGVGALAGWSQVRRYSWFVAGAILAGIGGAEVVGGLANGAFGSTISSLVIAAAFAAIYIRYPRRSMWALYPAGIMAVVAMIAFGAGLIGALPAVFGRMMLPLLLIGGGALLLFRHSLPPRTVKIGLAAVVAMFVVLGATSVPDIDPDPDFGFNFDGRRGPVIAQTLPVGAGQRLVLGGGGSGDVEFRTSDTAMASIEARDGRRPTTAKFQPIRDGFAVGENNGFLSNTSSIDYVVYLPPGVDVEVERGSGSVTGTLAGVRATITTGSGNVDLGIENGGEETFDDDGPIDIRTDSGDVTIGSPMHLDLRVRSEDDVEVNGENKNGRYWSPAGTTGVEVSVDSDSGDIHIDMADRPVEPVETTSPPSEPTEPPPPSSPPTSAAA